MAQPALSTSTGRFQGSVDVSGHTEAHSSGVTWSAVFGGAFVTMALSLALLALGTGIGLSAISPWSNTGASASAVGWGAIGWFVAVQIVASAIGGYLAGRLRTKWVSLHTHEVYFRDTAHGFLVWAVALVITAAFLTSAATSLINGAARSTVTAANEGAQASPRGAAGASGYLADTLLRTPTSNADPSAAATRSEVGTIFAEDLAQGSMPAADRVYLSQVVAAKTGVSQAEAEKRVDEAYSRGLENADLARKSLAHSMYWMFLALLVGAFSASFAATVGGRQRDSVATV
ncbi:MAG TPA: hypothetical protein VGH34_23590 [Vicinamibacterales bacterium]